MRGCIPRLLTGFVLGGLMFFGVAIQANANLIVNGDFETGDFSGWSASIDPTWDGVDDQHPQGGTFAAFFGNPFSISTISQSIATTPGGFFTIGFWLQTEADVNGNSIPNSFEFDWDGVSVMALNDASPDSAYQHYSFTLAATTALTAISFSFHSEPAFFDFDTVSVEAATVPEPGSLALVALAGAAVAFARRRRA